MRRGSAVDDSVAHFGGHGLEKLGVDVVGDFRGVGRSILGHNFLHI